jgi:TatD DNase family protein
MKYYNIHTHHLSYEPDVVSIQNIRVRGKMLEHPILNPDHTYYSVGIHPWDVTIQDTCNQFSTLRAAAQLPQVIAIGEAGLDKKHPTPFAIQQDVFEWQIKLSEQIQKPLLIHCVKAWSEVIAIKKQFKPSQPWIIHGFRGNLILAQQLLAHGFYLSYSTSFNKKSLSLDTLNRLFIETDDSATSIQSNYMQIASCLGLDIMQLQQVIANNFMSVFK